MQNEPTPSPVDNPLLVDFAQDSGALTQAYRKPDIYRRVLGTRTQVIVGAPGSGKTALMAQLARERPALVLPCAATLSAADSAFVHLEQRLLHSLAEATWQRICDDEAAWRELLQTPPYERKLLRTLFAEQFGRRFEGMVDRDLTQPGQREAVLGVDGYDSLHAMLNNPSRFLMDVVQMCLRCLGQAAEGQVMFMLDVPSTLTLTTAQIQALGQILRTQTAPRAVLKLFVCQRHCEQIRPLPLQVQEIPLEWDTAALTDVVDRQLARLRDSALLGYGWVPESLEALIGSENLRVLQQVDPDHAHHFLAATPVEWLHLAHCALQQRWPGAPNGSAMPSAEEWAEKWIEARRSYIAQRLRLRISPKGVWRGDTQLTLTRTELQLLLKLADYTDPQHVVLAKTLAIQMGLKPHNVGKRITDDLMPKLEALCMANVPEFERALFVSPRDRYRGCAYLKRVSEGYYLENIERIDA